MQALATSGAPLFPDIELENRLREYADLPEADPEERDRLMAGQSMASFFGGGGEQGSLPPGSSPSPGAQQQPQLPESTEEIEKAVRLLRPRYFDGTKWKTIRGRHRFLKDLRDEAMRERENA